MHSTSSIQRTREEIKNKNREQYKASLSKQGKIKAISLLHFQQNKRTELPNPNNRTICKSEIEGNDPLTTSEDLEFLIYAQKHAYLFKIYQYAWPDPRSSIRKSIDDF